MQSFSRLALFYAPAPDSWLARFGAEWLGWDAAAGTALAHPDLSLPIADLTATPRKYGFHGTLRPPFRLAPGKTPADVEDSARSLAASIRPFEIPPLRLTQIGSFLALVPGAPCPQLEALASLAVETCNPLRAPLTEAELTRRRHAGLSPRQEALLQRWGYPYVMEEFRFHLTLTGKLAGDMADTALGVLSNHIGSHLAAPVPVADICLFGEDKTGRFHIIDRFALGGS